MNEGLETRQDSELDKVNEEPKTIVFSEEDARPTIESISESTHKTRPRPEQTQPTEGQDKIDLNDKEDLQLLADLGISTMDVEAWRTYRNYRLSGKLVPAPQHVRNLRMFLRTCVVLNRVYPCRLKYKGDRFGFISFAQYETVVRDHNGQIPMFAVRLHIEKPFVTINPDKKMHHASDPNDEYSRKMGFVYGNKPPHVVEIRDLDLSEDMVNHILNMFERLMDEQESLIRTLIHFDSEGIVESRNGVDKDLMATLMELRNHHYAPDNPYIKNIIDFRTDGRNTDIRFGGGLVGFLVTFTDNSIAGAFISSSNGTLSTPGYHNIPKGASPSTFGAMGLLGGLHRQNNGYVAGVVPDPLFDRFHEPRNWDDEGEAEEPLPQEGPDTDNEQPQQ